MKKSMIPVLKKAYPRYSWEPNEYLHVNKDKALQATLWLFENTKLKYSTDWIREINLDTAYYGFVKPDPKILTEMKLRFMS